MRAIVLGTTLVATVLASCGHEPAVPTEGRPAAGSPGALALGHLFSDHLVLQRDRPVPIWGRSEPGDTLRVSLRSRVSETLADDDGRWRVVLDPLPAGGPDELFVQASLGGEIRVRDVLVGEVWLCAGQSNMGLRVKQAGNAEQEIRTADHPRLRVFMVAKSSPPDPATDVDGTWVASTPESVGGVSATAYFFGRSLQERLELPVGLIVSSIGGTSVEAWTSVAAQESVSEIRPALEEARRLFASREKLYQQLDQPGFFEGQYQRSLELWEEEAEQARAAGREPPRRPKLIHDPRWNKNHPGNLYNGMIAPLVGCGMRGVIWYQGEFNTGSSLEPEQRAFPELYALQLTALIRSWRAAWGQGDFPFYIVQLPNWLAPPSGPVQDHGWPLVREQQALVAASVPAVGLAVTLDIGDALSIHPPDKQAVGERLARLALARTYGLSITDSGPRFDRASRAGNRMRIDFQQAEGLHTVDGQSPQAFAVAGQDRVWHFARTRIDGSSVIAWSDEVSEPVAVRYAWAANPPVNLVNEAGLPAAPFRTDDWAIVLPPPERLANQLEED